MRLIKVAPLGEGWRVSLDGLANDMVFRSGGLAEAAARRLALRLARAGAPAEIRMHSSDQSLAWPLRLPRPSAAWPDVGPAPIRAERSTRRPGRLIAARRLIHQPKSCRQAAIELST